MPYLVDGHNLIPKIPGFSLQALDDEQRLVELLQEFCRIRRKEVEVYFDNAPPGFARTQKMGKVKAHFVRQGMTADRAIHLRLEKLGRTAPNWTVISSDAAVQSSARQFHAQVLPSEKFARLVLDSIDQSREAGPDRPEQVLPDEMDDWLKLFGEDEQGE